MNSHLLKTGRTATVARRPAAAGLSAGAAVLAAALWWRRHPSACPYGQRFWVQSPHPLITRRRLHEQGINNLATTQGDAHQLPYQDASFDAAYLVCVLGEIPDQQAALAELARVLKPGGRLVVGELFGDPHWVSPKRLRARAAAAGLVYERRLGTPLGYFTRLKPTRGAS